MSEQQQVTHTEISIQPSFVQWLVRYAFESGWRAAGGDQSQAQHPEGTAVWTEEWLKSEPRALLVRQGILSGGDAWR